MVSSDNSEAVQQKIRGRLLTTHQQVFVALINRIPLMIPKKSFSHTPFSYPLRRGEKSSEIENLQNGYYFYYVAGGYNSTFIPKACRSSSIPPSHPLRRRSSSKPPPPSSHSPTPTPSTPHQPPPHRVPAAGKPAGLKHPKPPSFDLLPPALLPALGDQLVHKFSLVRNLSVPLLQPLLIPLRLPQHQAHGG